MDVIKIMGTPLYQWELGRKISISTHEHMIINRVEFSTASYTETLMVEPREEDGVVVADVPNVLLQSGEYIYVYLSYKDENLLETTTVSILPVMKRHKPADYVYTETEVKTYENLENRITALEENVIPDELLAESIAEYLEKNPVESGATAEEAAQIQQNKEDIEKLNTDKLDADKLTEAVNDALAQAKASGEFDGKDGADGQPGKDGKDYVLTEADKQEIAGMVEVPGNGGNVDLTGYATEQYVDDAIANIDFPSGGSAEWRLLDTFDFSSGAKSYTADTTGCKEIIAIVETAITCSAASTGWKGIDGINSITKSVGSIVRLENFADGLIYATKTRDTTEPLASEKVYFGADQTNNEFTITCSTASAGIMRVYGR